ncbi:MAG: MFS transporter [Mycobacteriales bacterium]
MQGQPQRRRPANAAGRAVRRAGASGRRRLVALLGGRARTRVIVLLACVLALASADTATVGAAAIELRQALHIDNTEIGLLVAVSSLVGAAFSLPFGVLADRGRRTLILAAAVATFGVAMVWSSLVSSFVQLLEARLLLGAVTAATGPTVASLVGDWFPGSERGRIYSYILTGELLGAGVGFVVTGDVAAISWRAAFLLLAIPAFVLAALVAGLREPARGGEAVLRAEAAPSKPVEFADTQPLGRPGQQADATDAQRLARRKGIQPDWRLVRRARPNMRFGAAVRFVLSVRTNVRLIVSSACAYYFLAGVQTFGVEFVRGQYHLSAVLANLLLLLVGLGAVLGVLAGGPLGDALLRRGHLPARVVVGAVAAVFTVLLFIPALFTHSALTALPYVILAAAALSAQNPPIDAARLDIMPAWLWGRAEGVRTFLRTCAQALAPLLFGLVSDYVFGGGASGLRWTFVVMLLPLSIAAWLLFKAARSYPRDVATAAGAMRVISEPATGGPAHRTGDSASGQPIVEPR